jgi:hypothetical protein
VTQYTSGEASQDIVKRICHFVSQMMLYLGPLLQYIDSPMLRSRICFSGYTAPGKDIDVALAALTPAPIVCYIE